MPGSTAKIGLSSITMTSSSNGFRDSFQIRARPFACKTSCMMDLGLEVHESSALTRQLAGSIRDCAFGQAALEKHARRDDHSRQEGKEDV